MADEFDYYQPRELIGWKAYYIDGSIYRSDEYKWEDIPQDGLQILTKYFYNPEKNLKYKEVNCAHDVYSLNDDIRDKLDIPKELKIGRWMEQNAFNLLRGKAQDDEEIIEVRI